MANFVSPGVYVIEKDISDYPAQINSSVVGIVGFADRGPIAGINNQKATLITSQQGLIDTFGEPAEHIKGQALEGALEILEATNSMRFIRVSDSSRLSASAAVQIGACPAIMVSGTQVAPIYGTGNEGTVNMGMSAIGSADSTTSSVRFIVTAYDNDRNKIVDARTYTIPPSTVAASASEGATSIEALKKVIGGSLDSDRVGAFANANTVDASSYIVGLAAGGTATLSVSMEILQDNGTSWEPMEGVSAVSLIGALVDAESSSVTASGVTADPSATSYLVKSIWPGAGYNAGTKADGTTSGVSFEVGLNGNFNSQEQVNNLGVAAETFIAGATSASFLENQLGTTYDSRTSNYVLGNFAAGGGGAYDDTVAVTPLTSFTSHMVNLFGAATALTGGQGTATGATIDPMFVKLVQGTYNLADGDSGIPTAAADVATAVIGSVQSDGGKTGMEALDDPILNVSIALAPGPGVGDSQTIQNGLITVAERTTDFLALISPPYAVGKPGDAIDWSNGFATSRTAAVNSSYAALYWPWVKVFQVFDGKDRWLAPEIYGARQMGVTDAVADPWFAPAGFVRGRLTKPTDVEVILNQGDRDSMYSGGNCINPIVNFPQNGIAIFGQRTTQRQPTALDRINVRRMMIYIKKVILASTQRLVFEPNDKFTWTRVEQLINPLLDDIMRRRGITEFKVICDETTNTPIRVDRNEMWCKVLIKPTKTAEIVIFELNLTNQSAQLG
jgi:phage tail sheath protein FI